MPTTNNLRGGSGRHRTLNALRNLAGIALAVAFVFFLVETVRDQVGRIGASALLPGWPGILLSVGLLFAWALMFLWASESCLRRLLGVSRSLPLATTAAAFFKSFLLRYIPGKIWTAVGRAETLVPAVPRVTTFRCVLYEQLHLNVATMGLAILLTGLLAVDHGIQTRLPLLSSGATTPQITWCSGGSSTGTSRACSILCGRLSVGRTGWLCGRSGSGVCDQTLFGCRLCVELARHWLTLKVIYAPSSARPSRRKRRGLSPVTEKAGASMRPPKS